MGCFGGPRAVSRSPLGANAPTPYEKTTTIVYTHMRKNAFALDLRVAFSRFRLYSTVSPRAIPNSPPLNPKERELTPDQQKEKGAEFRKRKTEWKRRQGVRHV